MRQPAVLSKPPPSGGPVPTPAGWTRVLPFSVVRRGNRFRAAGWDFDSFRPAAAKTYHVSLTGNDTTGDGLTPATAFRSIWKAATMADVDRVLVAPGEYTRARGLSGFNITRSLSIEPSAPGRVVCGAYDNSAVLTWSQHAGPVYKCTRGSVLDVRDDHPSQRLASGDEKLLVKRASVAEVAAEAGSWFLDVGGGNVLYVRLWDDRAVDAYVHVYLAAAGAVAQGNITVWLDRIDFAGGFSAFRIETSGAGQNPKCYARDCSFKYHRTADVPSLGNGFTSLGAETYLLRCVSAWNQRDGFNYHAYNGVVPHAVEIDCVGRDNGFSGANNDNGSTMHDGGSVVRLNGEYGRNGGPNVADVKGTGLTAESWNLGCRAHDSTGSAAADAEVGFYSDGTMWLDRCRAWGDEFGAYAHTGGTVYLHRSSVTPTGGTGEVFPYTPSDPGAAFDAGFDPSFGI